MEKDSSIMPNRVERELCVNSDSLVGVKPL